MLSLTSPHFTLAEDSEGQRVNLDAPLPLGYVDAIRMATHLRKHKPMTWPAIALVMRAYHGWDKSPDWWRRETHGRVAPRPRASAFRARA